MSSDGGSLGRRIGWNGLAQILPMLTQLGLTPYFIKVLGLDGFGLWSLLLVFVGTLTALDGGIGASLARFFAIHAARRAPDETGRLLLAALFVFVLLGAVLSGVAIGLAPLVADWLHLNPSLRPAAVDALRWVGLLVFLALVNGSVVALLQANNRFRGLTASTAVGQLAYVVASLALLRPGSAVSVLVWVLVIRYVSGLIVAVVAARGLVRFTRPLVPGREERAVFRAYAGRMQLSSMTSFLNGEVDALVVAAILPVRYVGIFAAAHQVASAARSLPLFAFPPVLANISRAFARSGEPGARTEFDRLESRWLPLVLGYTAVAACAATFAVPVWLGDDFTLAGVLAAILTLAYGVHVALTGIRTCFVRSIGRPGLETRYSFFSTIVNVVLTVPFALAWGVVGVVAATAVALMSASLYFVRLCRPFDIRDRLSHRLWWPAIAVAAAITVAGELVVRQAGWHGPFALAAAGLPAALGLAVLVPPLLRQITHSSGSEATEGGQGA